MGGGWGEWRGMAGVEQPKRRGRKRMGRRFINANYNSMRGEGKGRERLTLRKDKLTSFTNSVKSRLKIPGRPRYFKCKVRRAV